jgi:hypothetical protein
LIICVIPYDSVFTSIPYAMFRIKDFDHTIKIKIKYRDTILLWSPTVSHTHASQHSHHSLVYFYCHCHYHCHYHCQCHVPTHFLLPPWQLGEGSTFWLRSHAAIVLAVMLKAWIPPAMVNSSVNASFTYMRVRRITDVCVCVGI